METKETTKQVWLIDGRAQPRATIAATMIRNFSGNRLKKVEVEWGPHRKTITDTIRRAGKPVFHSHWNWTNKVDRIDEGRLQICAVECDGSIQGLLSTATTPRVSGLKLLAPVLYVDYIETAPWNLIQPTIPPRFIGIGSLFLLEAVLLSLDRSFEGRVGLHSLPSSEDFYRHKCGMTDLGPDPAYFDLRYFEYTSIDALNWLSHNGVVP